MPLGIIFFSSYPQPEVYIKVSVFWKLESGKVKRLFNFLFFSDLKRDNGVPFHQSIYFIDTENRQTTILAHDF